MTTSMHAEKEQSGEALLDIDIAQITDNFFMMMNKLADSKIPIDPDQVDVRGWYEEAVAKDKLLNKFAKDRREELREIARKRKEK